MKKEGSLLIVLALAGFLFFHPVATEARLAVLPASFPVGLLQEPFQANGEFVIRVWENHRWRPAARLPMGKFPREATVSLGRIETEDGTVRVKISQRGGGKAYLDSVLLNGNGPSEIRGTPDPLAIKKIAQKDLDLLDAGGREIDLTFYADTPDVRLSLTGRIEALEISRTPLQFPLANLHQPMTAHSRFLPYPLQSAEQMLADTDVFGRLSALEPFHQAWSTTGSGHPAGTTYFWVGNDADHLYVAVDFTSDNTRDGDEDYVKVYIRAGEDLREFKVSEGETRWGRTAFTYTDKVSYQHKTYEFKIPFSAIGLPDGRKETDLHLAFAAYGTVSAPGDYTPALAYDSANNRYLLVYKKMSYPGGPGTEARDVYARFVLPNGVPVNPELPLTSTGSSTLFQPAVAFDSVNRRYLAVWEDSRNGGAGYEIYGQWINNGGIPEGANFPVGNIGSPKSAPDVAFDSVNKRFLVIWRQGVSYPQLYGKIINQDGTLFLDDFLISDYPACAYRSPKAAYDPVSKRYLVVWSSSCSGPDVIQGRSLQADGTMPAGSFDIAATGIYYPAGPAVAHNADRQQFLVVWGHFNSGKVFGSIRDWAGTVVKSEFSVTPGGVPIEAYPDASYDTRHKQYLVIWQSVLDPDSHNILGQRVDSDGVPVGPPFTVADLSPNLWGPAVEYNSRCGNFLAAYEIRDTVRAIGLNIVGAPACPVVYLPLLMKP